MQPICMHDRKESVFCISRSDSPPAFQSQKCVFYQATQSIDNIITKTLIFSVLSRWSDRFHSFLLCFFNNCIRIIALVSQKIVSRNAVNQLFCNRAIRNGTRCDNDSARTTKRIHGQMHLCVEHPFVRSMSWFPPTAPAACQQFQI